MLPKDTRIGLLAPITRSIPPYSYGPWEKVVYNLASGLVERGYTNIYVYATAETSIPGVRVRSLLDKPLGEDQEGNELSHYKELAHIAYSIDRASKEVEIIHNHLYFSTLLFSLFTSVPIVTTLHGPAGEDPGSSFVFGLHPQLPYVSISNSERRSYPDLNYLATVYNGIDFNEFTFGGSPKNYLVYTGRIHPDKGVHNAIYLAKKFGIPLHIAGLIQPECRGYFESQVRPHIDGRQVVFLGNLSAHDVKKLVSEAIAYIGLIEWEEPFGLSIAEAMACGTPAIAMARGSHTEIVIDKVTGILVNSVDEALKRFPEILSINRLQCREAAMRIFSVAQMVEGYIHVYENVIQNYEKYS